MTELPANCPVREGDLLAGKYRIERALGVGGMGVVLQAMHVDLGQRVAIKLMLREMLRHPELVARFTREARAAARLQNDHVVRVMDVSRLETGEPFMVMEYLKGRDMAALVLAEGAQPVQQTVDRVLQACEAIAEAHSVGIIHRDLKPANLFLVERPDGTTTVKVLDFGISKMTTGEAADAQMTATASVLGSPAFMSPEQMRSAKHVDARSDIWALGVILYELLTGHSPFAADTMVELVARITVDPPVPPRQYRAELPAALERVMLSCLEKDPARRPQTVADLAGSLAPFASQQGVGSVARIRNVLRASGFAGQTVPIEGASAPPPSIAATAPGPGGRTNAAFGVTSDRSSKTRWLPAAATAVLLTASAGGFALWHLARSADGSPDEAVSAPATDLVVPSGPGPLPTASLPTPLSNPTGSAGPGSVEPAGSNPAAAASATVRAPTVARTAGAREPATSQKPPTKTEPPKTGGEIDYSERK